jgi:hypothetical protein
MIPQRAIISSSNICSAKLSQAAELSAKGERPHCHLRNFLNPLEEGAAIGIFAPDTQFADLPRSNYRHQLETQSGAVDDTRTRPGGVWVSPNHPICKAV